LGCAKAGFSVAARTPVAPTALRNSERLENRADPFSGSPDINPSLSRDPEFSGRAGALHAKAER